MRSCARLTSDKLTRCFGRSATGRTTQSKYISGVGFLSHTGKDDASNTLRKYVQFCTIKLFASPFRKPESQKAWHIDHFFWPCCKFEELAIPRRPSVHPPAYPSFGRSHRPRTDATWMFTRDGRNSPRVWESITRIRATMLSTRPSPPSPAWLPWWRPQP
jgi:hypothetical protein